MSGNPNPIRIAISGGGLSGASLFQALTQYPHLDVHIFESAPEIRRDGLAIGVTRNAQAALDLMGPPAPQILQRAGAVAMKGVRFMVGEGEGMGEVIDEVGLGEEEGGKLTSIVHRAKYLGELLAEIPEDRVHVSKKLASVEIGKSERDSEGVGKGEGEGVGEGPITLHFTDGSEHECDILVGADGIHSTVRKLILGPDDPAANPRNTGLWCVMTLQPYAKAREIIGSELVNARDPREYSWVGQGTKEEEEEGSKGERDRGGEGKSGGGSYILHNVLSDTEVAQFVIASSDDVEKAGECWTRTVTSEEIRRLYRGWQENLRNAVDEFLCQQPEHTAIYLWEHAPARTYVSGPLCVVGDAAHATTPWQGSGGGMSIEDSLILSTLLGRARNPREARAALRAYDYVRRPRTQRIVESSRETGGMLIGKGVHSGVEMKRRGNLLERWDFILDIDMLGHRNEAILKMREEVAALGG